MHIACTIDDHYVMPLCGMLASFFRYHGDSPVSVHVFTHAASPTVPALLERFIDRHGATFVYHPLAEGGFKALQVHYRHFSAANFYRLQIPEVLHDCQRILYLDVDLLVREPLHGLYGADLGGHPLGAVSDAYPPADCKRLGIPPQQGYFNSGVLLMDLPAMRQHDISGKALAYLQQHNGDRVKCRYADQDGLNIAAAGRWQSLPAKWNFNIYHASLDPAKLPETYRGILAAGPGILHFADRKKPWMREHAMPFQQEFLEQARASGITYPRPSWRQIRPWFKDLRALWELRACYHRAHVPWHA